MRVELTHGTHSNGFKTAGHGSHMPFVLLRQERPLLGLATENDDAFVSVGFCFQYYFAFYNFRLAARGRLSLPALWLTFFGRGGGHLMRC